MPANRFPFDPSRLAELGIDSARLRSTVPPHQRDGYRAAINWLTDYEPDANAPRLEQVRAYLEAFYHLSEVDAWEAAGKVLCIPLDPPNKRSIMGQLSTWAHRHELCELYIKLIGKIDAQTNEFCLAGLCINHPDAAQGIKYGQACLVLLEQQGKVEQAAALLSDLGVRAADSSKDEIARYYYEEALPRLRTLNDLPGLGLLLHRLARTLHNLGDYAKAYHYFAEALNLYTNVLKDKDTVAFAWFYHNYGLFLTEQGELSKARAYLHQGLRIFRQREDNTGIGWSLQCLGKLLFYSKKDSSAQRCLIRAPQAFGTNRKGRAWTDHYLGQLALRKQKYGPAREYFQEALKIHQERNNLPDMAYALDAFAQLAAAEQRWSQSVRLFGAAATLRIEGKLPLRPVDRAQYDHDVARVRTVMDEELFAQAWSTGQALTLEQAIAEALAENQKLATSASG